MLVQVILGLWLAATVVRQFNWPWYTRSVPGPLFAVLPSWSFFAPNPGQADTKLVYRERLDQNTMTDWGEICLRPINSIWRFIWNPDRLKLKALLDMALLLARLEAPDQYDPEIIVFAWPYVALLDRVMAAPRLNATSQSRQFAIIASKGTVPPRELSRIFVSRWHDFD